MNNANYTLATDLKQLISTEQAHHYRIVPLSVEENKVVFWTAATAAENTASELQIVLGKKVQLFETSEEELQRYLRVNYRQSNTTSKTQLRYSEDFLVKVLQEAQEIGSSDVHFEIFKNNGRVRFRIDGKLIERYLIELKEYPILVNRIKIMAQLDISEKRLPQDGRIHRLTADGEFDIRVSVLPTLHGEKMVLRILTKENNSLQLDHLGFGKKELKRYREGLKKPQGMVLISGPTGSGKTTTLYATLKQLNKLQTNILTIEDPIEYTLEGINQVALKERIGLDFPNALRTFLRQDPDIIMVGEIRDPATANMAVRAALTGHLVLSTIHTNSAWATISRLIDMDIPPFLIANTLNLSVAQRLIRQLCIHCKQEVLVTKDVFPENFSIPKELRMHFKAKGCSHCFYTGYHGRKALYEVLPITEELCEYIKKSESKIEPYLTANHIKSLKSNAVELLKNGDTSVEEIYALLT